MKTLFHSGLRVLYSVCVCSRALTSSRTQKGSLWPPRSADFRPFALKTAEHQTGLHTTWEQALKSRYADCRPFVLKTAQHQTGLHTTWEQSSKSWYASRQNAFYLNVKVFICIALDSYTFWWLTCCTLYLPCKALRAPLRVQLYIQYYSWLFILITLQENGWPHKSLIHFYWVNFCADVTEESQMHKNWKKAKRNPNLKLFCTVILN